ncbi:MAG TPA: tRNA lysidine(34) synthetase TilS [Acidobacteriota bacterium]|nr:tRNA lysidine(34) synthetase TilS [Acidobacteriota bacterium]
MKSGKEQLEFQRLVEQALMTRCHLRTGDRVVVALSGGPDSVALLHVFVELSVAWDLDLHAAHVNHQLRGKESDGDERFVRELCDTLGVDLVVGRFDVGRYTGNLEDNARRIRYRFLLENARKMNAIIATGHTLDDQAETFLMKLVRGAGPEGLSSIHPVLFELSEEETQSAGVNVAQTRKSSADPVRIIRPLLDIRRSQVLDYLRQIGLGYRLDRTNQDLGFDRNWIRHCLIPLLEERLNPRIVETLSRSATLFSELDEYLRDQADRLEGAVLPTAGEIDISAIQVLPLPLQRVLARRAIRRNSEAVEISFTHTDDLLALCRATSGKSISLPGGLRAAREFNRIRLSSDLERPKAFSYSFRVPGQVHVPEVGKILTVAHAPLEGASERPSLDKLTMKGIQETLRLPNKCRLTVRNRRPGDRVLLPSGSSRKLKQLFLEQRVPLRERDRLLLLELDGRIVWAEGLNGRIMKPESVFRSGRGDVSLVEMFVSCETFLA